MREASLVCSETAIRALDETFAELPRGADDVCVLAYVIDSKEPDGTVTVGFQPGYIAMVWPPGYAASDCAFGHISDGSPLVLVSRHCPADTAASVEIEVLGGIRGMFTATPLEEP